MKMRKLVVLLVVLGSLCSFLAVGQAEDQTTKEKYEATQNLCVVNVDGLHVRTHPSTDGYIICSLTKGDKVCSLGTVKDEDGEDWYYIIMKSGNIGWVFGQYITVPE
jgi:uncharacterized protein YgiM (DUF1202 family)